MPGLNAASFRRNTSWVPTQRSHGPKNGTLGWFVVGSIVLVGLVSLAYGLLEQPLVFIECIILGTGLVVRNQRSESFGQGWFTATAIVGFVTALGAIGIASGGAASGGGSLLLVPAALALVARLRS